MYFLVQISCEYDRTGDFSNNGRPPQNSSLLPLFEQAGYAATKLESVSQRLTSPSYKAIVNNCGVSIRLTGVHVEYGDNIYVSAIAQFSQLDLLQLDTLHKLMLISNRAIYCHGYQVCSVGK